MVVYDQTGDLGSREVAEELRKKGWLMARRLQGGFAEWIEYGEEVQSPISAGTYTIGDPILYKSENYFIHRLIVDPKTQEISSVELCLQRRFVNVNLQNYEDIIFLKDTNDVFLFFLCGHKTFIRTSISILERRRRIYHFSLERAHIECQHCSNRGDSVRYLLGKHILKEVIIFGCTSVKSFDGKPYFG